MITVISLFFLGFVDKRFIVVQKTICRIPQNKIHNKSRQNNFPNRNNILFPNNMRTQRNGKLLLKARTNETENNEAVKWE